MFTQVLLVAVGVATVFAESPLTPIASWALPTQFGTHKSFDHIWLDAGSDSLFVAAKSVNQLYRLNGTSGAIITNVGFTAPQGLAIANGLLWVGSDNGTLAAFDPVSLSVKTQFAYVDDTDDVKVDSVGNVYAATGDLSSGSYKDGRACLVKIDTSGAVPVEVNHTDLDAHVEGFAIVPGTPFTVASTPDSQNIFVVDMSLGKHTQTWPVPSSIKAVTPLIFDNATQHIITASRNPGSLAIFDYSNSGKLLANIACECTDADDVFLDSKSKTVLVSSGAPAPGLITAFQQEADGAYTLLGTSTPGGKTSWLDEASRRFFVAVPATSSADGFIQVYALP